MALFRLTTPRDLASDFFAIYRDFFVTFPGAMRRPITWPPSRSGPERSPRASLQHVEEQSLLLHKMLAVDRGG